MTISWDWDSVEFAATIESVHNGILAFVHLCKR